MQGAQSGTRAWYGTPGEDLQEGQQGVVAMQQMCGEGTMKEEDWQMKMIENNQCPCCSHDLVEGCCMECGEVYE